MLSLQLRESLRRLILNLASNPVSGLVQELSEAYPKLTDELIKLNSHSAEENLMATFRELDRFEGALVRKIRADYRPGVMFVSLSEVIDNLRAINRELGPGDVSPVQEVIAAADYFYKQYEAFLVSYNSRDTRYLVIAAHDFHLAVQTLRPFAWSISETLDPSSPVDAATETLSLILTSHNAFRGVVLKLEALEGMYEELCRLLDISPTERPLDVLRIESGSLLTKIFGESKVVQLMTELIKSAAQYFYRNYTTEGKIQSVPKTAEAIVAMLDLSNRLKESGIKSEVVDENLKQSAVVLAKQLTTLLAGEPTVTVNDTTYSVADEWQQRYLKEGRSLFLTPGDAPDSEDSQS